MIETSVQHYIHQYLDSDPIHDEAARRLVLELLHRNRLDIPTLAEQLGLDTDRIEQIVQKNSRTKTLLNIPRTGCFVLHKDHHQIQPGDYYVIRDRNRRIVAGPMPGSTLAAHIQSHSDPADPELIEVSELIRHASSLWPQPRHLDAAV